MRESRNSEPTQDKQHAEENSHYSEEKYRELFESIDEGFCIIKMIFDESGNPVDYRFEEVNPAFEKHTGMEDVEGKTMRQIIPHHEDRWFEVYGEVASTGKPIRFEQPARALNRVLELYAFPFGEPGNNKVAVLFKDITERKQAQKEREQLLRQVEAERERLSDIFQHAPSFMCILRGPDHIFERANELYYKLVGDREIIGKPVIEALPEVKGQGFIELLDKVYQTGEPISISEQQLVLEKEGEVRKRYLDFVYQPFRDSDGKVTGIFVQGVDLTERKKAQIKLQEMNENLEERVKERTKSLLSYQNQLRSLASRLSKAEEQERQQLATELHDNLGQMLALSKMKMDLLKIDNLPDETAEYLEDVRQGLNDALDYTRNLMSDLKPPPSLDKHDITATLEWVAEKMEKHNLKVIVKDDGQPKRASEDIRTTLLQSVRELLMNVVKHSGADKAYIDISRLDNQVQVIVEDEGQGFNHDRNASGSIEENSFGLFNIRERIDLLGGSMELFSEPGEGTKVKVLAPLLEKEKSFEIQNRSENNNIEITQRSNQEITVLLADDQLMIRKGLIKVMDAEDDIKVIAEASDGKEAVELAREKRPDIVVMDVDMPNMNGIDATKKITSEMPAIRVVALSLHDHHEVVESMRHAGASAYISKNEAFENLCATLRSEAKVTKEWQEEE